MAKEEIEISYKREKLDFSFLGKYWTLDIIPNMCGINVNLFLGKKQADFAKKANVRGEHSRDIYKHRGFLLKVKSFNDLFHADGFVYNLIEDKDRQYFTKPELVIKLTQNNEEFIQIYKSIKLILAEDAAERLKRNCSCKKCFFRKERVNYYYDVIIPLKKKYGLFDIEVDRNWGLDAETMKPIIYDFGFIGYGCSYESIARIKSAGIKYSLKGV